MKTRLLLAALTVVLLAACAEEDPGFGELDSPNETEQPSDETDDDANEPDVPDVDADEVPGGYDPDSDQGQVALAWGSYINALSDGIRDAQLTEGVADGPAQEFLTQLATEGGQSFPAGDLAPHPGVVDVTVEQDTATVDACVLLDVTTMSERPNVQLWPTGHRTQMTATLSQGDAGWVVTDVAEADEHLSPEQWPTFCALPEQQAASVAILEGLSDALNDAAGDLTTAELIEDSDLVGEFDDPEVFLTLLLDWLDVAAAPDDNVEVVSPSSMQLDVLRHGASANDTANEMAVCASGDWGIVDADGNHLVGVSGGDDVLLSVGVALDSGEVISLFSVDQSCSEFGES